MVPSSVEQPHPLPILPNNINNVSRRTTREIKHIVMTNTNKARFDPCATSAWLVSFFAAFLSNISCSSGLVSIEVGLSPSNVEFMKNPSVNGCISDRLPVISYRKFKNIFDTCNDSTLYHPCCQLLISVGIYTKNLQYLSH